MDIRSFLRRAGAAVLASVLVLCSLGSCRAREAGAYSCLSDAQTLILDYTQRGEHYTATAVLGEGEEAQTRLFGLTFTAPGALAGLRLERTEPGGAVWMAVGDARAEAGAGNLLLLPLRALCTGGAEPASRTATDEGHRLILLRESETFTLYFRRGEDLPHTVAYDAEEGSVTLTLTRP